MLITTQSYILKRDDRKVRFDFTRIAKAISKANKETGEIPDESTISGLATTVARMKSIWITTHPDKITSVEVVQNAVEEVLMRNGFTRTAKAYILYRAERTRLREGKSDLMQTVQSILVETSKENANISNSPSAKMLQIGSAASKAFYLNRVIPKRFSDMHKNGDIHIHDLDFYGKTLTCVHIPLGQLLANGFDTGHGYIRPPKSARSASALAAIILQSSQNDMHGGQSFAFFDTHMAPYFEEATEREAYQAMEALVYNLNSMHSRAGAQVPFSSLNVGTDTTEAGRKVTRNLLTAYNAGLGRGENPIFPNIIFRLKRGINFLPGDPNYDLFQLAIKVACSRLNPSFLFLDAEFNKPFGLEVATMGCRTRVIANRHGHSLTDCRGNLSFTTINLPRLAIAAKGKLEPFLRNLKSVTDAAVAQLYHRYDVQANLRVMDMPFLMGQHLYMGSEKLKPTDKIEPAIKHGTLAVGFIGLAETLTMLTGLHHGESKEAQELGLRIVSFMRQATDEACDAYDLNYTLLATPAEGLAGRFVRMDKQLYGTIKGVTDKDYYTNSFHVPVNHDTGYYDKIKIEGPYHGLCNAGHISYVEMGSPPIYNPEAVETMLHHMEASGMGYGAINYPVDICRGCGHRGVMPDSCPKCGSYDVRRVRRITGYLSTEDRFNSGKLAELKDRRPHVEIPESPKSK